MKEVISVELHDGEVDPNARGVSDIMHRNNKKRTPAEAMMDRHAAEREVELKQLTEKYERPEVFTSQIKKVKSKRLRSDLNRMSKQQQEAAESAARAEILLTETEGFLEPENALEKTYKFTQHHMKNVVDMNTQAKMLDLKLPQFSPYNLRWTKNGRHLIIGGRKGHVSVIDTLRNEQQTEILVQETVRDVSFLHNHSMFAVAQKKHIYIYDENGSEVHRLRSHIQPEKIEFLPYHFLLASVGKGGWLKYQDTSTGDLVSEHRTKLGPCDTMTQNPWNAVMCLGHLNGTVTMWSPSCNKPLVKMFCHGAPVKAITVDRQGHHLVTGGLDGKVSIWDIRTYKKLHSYHSPRPPMSLDLSQRGLLAVSSGYQVQIWKDALTSKQTSPYMRHGRPGDELASVRFRPFEDVLALGHTSGVQTIIVPGAGAANYDAFEANPFENSRQRRETEVHSLLEKIQPEMIVLEPNMIGGVDTADLETIQKEREEEMAAKDTKPEKQRNKQRGKGKIGRKIKAKHINIITAERQAYRTSLEKEKETENNIDATVSNKPAIYNRFGPKSK